MTIDLVFALTGVSLLLMSIISYVTFGWLSVLKIEKSIMSEGKPRPCPWDGVGARVVWYAYTVALPASCFNEIDDRQLNTADVKRYTTRADRIRAWSLMIPLHGMMLLVFTGIIFDIG